MDVDCGSARDRLGRTFGGKYHLKEVLGAGGTAVVYRAQDSDGQMVAIKVLHDHLSRSEEVCRRFVREGQLGNVLDHPGTVRVLDHGQTEERCPYLVLEMLEGESLEERRVRLGGRLEMWETLDLCDQLLAVLEIAHAKKIVHRDIKPSNLFMTRDGKLKVLDFGIARLTDDTSSATSTKTGQMVGTPAFMPPEQALSRPRDVDARTDIWSVGATLFTLLSGEHVHVAETSSEHLVKAATLHARSLARVLPGVPAHVEALVAKSLAFDKTERWSSAVEMRAELTRVRADPGRRVGTSTTPPPERTPSNPNMPTLVGPPRSNRSLQGVSGPASDRGSDRGSDAAMALTSNPGGYDLMRPRRKWLMPFAIASTVLLVFMSALVLVLVVRKAPVAATAGANTKANGRAPDEAPPGAVTLPPASPASPVVTAAPVVEPPAVTSPTPAPAAARTPSTSTVTPSARPAASLAKKPTPASRKELYRPF